MPIFAQSLISCETSKISSSASIKLPNLPSSIRRGGKLTPIPKSAKGLTEKETNELLIRLRESEANNARAAKSAQRFYDKIKKEYEAP
jgi:hypothetical protein